MNNFIKLKNISKKYSGNKNIEVLKDINFIFEPGKIYSIVGPSGSGKSTLLNLLSLIDVPSSGSIELHENKINFTHNNPHLFINSANIKLLYEIIII